jgi:hypothetical protein
MTVQNKLRYSQFWDRINIDAFEEAIGFNPEYQRGDNDVGFCLWPENHSHGDTTGKFAIHRELRLYNCYVCGGGDLLSLVMELHDVDQETATAWLYQFCEEDMRSDAAFVDDFMASFEDVQRRVDTLPYFNQRVLDQFSDPIPEDFYAERGIFPLVAKAYGVRYSAEAKRPSPQKGKYAEDEDYYGPAIIFPHYWQNRLVGWQSRWLEDEDERPDWVPKYTMTSDFPKESTVYGFDYAKKAEEPVVVVESVPSALFAISGNYPAVATFGSSVNPAQLRLLRRFTQGVILAPDNDSAGVKWLNANTEYLKRYIPVWHLPPVREKPGADLGDIASNLHHDCFDLLNDFICQKYEPGIDL